MGFESSMDRTHVSLNTLIASRELLRTIHAPVHVFWTSDVPFHEAEVAVQGVDQALQALGGQRRLEVLGSEKATNGPFGSPDWFLHTALKNQDFQRDIGYGPQADVGEIMHLFAVDPWQREPSVGPHLNVFIVNTDLTDYTDRQTPLWKLVPPDNPLRKNAGPHTKLNYVYGSTYGDFATVQSIRRLTSDIPGGALRDEMLRRLIRHELGHVFGIPSAARTMNVENNLGKHCTNVCTMRQGLSMADWQRETSEEMRQGVAYCGDCRQDFRDRARVYKPTR